MLHAQREAEPTHGMPRAAAASAAEDRPQVEHGCCEEQRRPERLDHAPEDPRLGHRVGVLHRVVPHPDRADRTHREREAQRVVEPLVSDGEGGDHPVALLRDPDRHLERAQVRGFTTVRSPVWRTVTAPVAIRTGGRGSRLPAAEPRCRAALQPYSPLLEKRAVQVIRYDTP